MPDSGFLWIFAPERIHSTNRNGSLDPLYQAEEIFLPRALSDWTLRTRVLGRARLFYVPTLLHRRGYGNIMLRRTAVGVQSLISELQSEDPIFNMTWAHNRSRVVFFLTNDKGACMVPRADVGLGGPLFITHWGLRAPWFHMLRKRDTWMEEDATAEREGACATAADMIVPPYIGRSTAAARARSRPRVNWRCQLSFVGSIGRSKSSTHCNGTDPHSPVRTDLCYSAGVRAAVVSQHSNRTGFCFAAFLPVRKRPFLMAAPFPAFFPGEKTPLPDGSALPRLFPRAC